MKLVKEMLGGYANNVADETGYIFCELVGNHPDFNGEVSGWNLINEDGDKIRYISDEGNGAFDEEEGFEEEWEKIISNT